MKYVIKIAVTILLLIYLFSQIDKEAFYALLKRVELWYLVLPVLLMAGQILVTGLRWFLILRTKTKGVSLRRALEIHLIGLFSGTFLSNIVGSTFVRSGFLLRHRVPFAAGFSTVLLDRAYTLLTLLLLVLISLPFMPFMPDIAYSQAFLFLGLGCVALGALALMTYWLLSKQWSARVFSFAKECLDQVMQICTNLPLLVMGLITTFLGQLCYYGAILVLAYYLGMEVHLVHLLILLPLIALISGLPISFGGWGVREGAMAYGVVQIGGTLEEGVLLSVLIGVLGLLALLPSAGLCFLRREKLSLVTKASRSC